MHKSLSPPLLFRVALLLAVAMLIAGAAFTTARATGGYSVNWYTFDGGGGSSTGGTYTVMGTIGQADAGEHSTSGYDLTGGFWAWVARYLLFEPLIRYP